MASSRTPRKADPRVTTSAVAQYKVVLRRVLDNRPSGTRQRLAHALGKNRSFISQISNPIYPVPIPAQHLETIFSVCHFGPAERREFLEPYAQAHKTQMRLVAARQATRGVTLQVPDLGDAQRNRLLDDLLTEMVRSLARHIEQF